MKVFIALACLVAVASAIPVIEEDKDAIDLDLIEEINNGGHTWTAGINNRFHNTKLSEVKAWLGVLPDYTNKVLPKKEQPINENIPEEFDSRTAWSQCKSIGHIRDQGPCGSCWAFGAVEAMSDRICIASGQKDQTELSAEDVVSCCGFACGSGCNGGYPSAAWEFAVDDGIPSESAYPYAFPSCEHHVNGTKPACPPVQPTPKCDKNKEKAAKVHFKTSYGVGERDQEIQTEIMNNGPVEAAFSVYEDFLAYKSGVYQHKSGSMLGGHAIKIMGWGSSPQPYWLVANSWNEDWGDKGTFKILRGDCGINDGVVAGEPL
jgi:cathepsin B